MKLIGPVLLVELIEGAAVVGEKVAADPTQEHGQGRVAVVEVADGKAILAVEEGKLVSVDRKGRVGGQHEGTLVGAEREVLKKWSLHKPPRVEDALVGVVAHRERRSSVQGERVMVSPRHGEIIGRVVAEDIE